MLQEKWFGAIQNIITRGSKKKLVPETTKPRLLKRFYNSVAALMTQHLQDMCIRSLRAYTEYVCDVGVSLFAVTYGINFIYDFFLLYRNQIKVSD